MKPFFQSLWVLCLLLLCSSCSDEHESILYHYLHFMLPDGTGSATVLSDADAINTYNIYLCSDEIAEPFTVTYAVECEGLTEGVDYEMLSQSTTVSFLPGVYEMPVRIHWMPNRIDDDNLHTLTLRLVSCSNASVALGMPGPDSHLSTLVFRKVNL